MLYKLMGSQDLLMGPSGVRWVHVGLKWGQEGTKGVKLYQVPLIGVKWAIMRGLVSVWVNDRVIGRVSERFSKR